MQSTIIKTAIISDNMVIQSGTTVRIWGCGSMS
ncbi:uncharacterized protein METZ01_LOCUS266609, partial [marine metagenome]